MLETKAASSSLTINDLLKWHANFEHFTYRIQWVGCCTQTFCTKLNLDQYLWEYVAFSVFQLNLYSMPIFVSLRFLTFPKIQTYIWFVDEFPSVYIPWNFPSDYSYIYQLSFFRRIHCQFIWSSRLNFWT